LAVHPLTHLPSAWAIGAALALALGGTSLAYICYFWLLETVGPTRTSIVTYLLPCMALVYGILLLHEPLAGNALAGLALILMGLFFAAKPTPAKKEQTAPQPQPDAHQQGEPISRAAR
jgi:drug/metabolite transporter (DMT)-like permease